MSALILSEISEASQGTQVPHPVAIIGNINDKYDKVSSNTTLMVDLNRFIKLEASLP